MKAIVESLENALNIAVSSIRQLETHACSGMGEQGKETINPSVLEELFRGMLASLDEYNPTAVRPHLDKIRRVTSPQQLGLIKQKVERFDFMGAKDETLKLAFDLGIEFSDG